MTPFFAPVSRVENKSVDAVGLVDKMFAGGIVPRNEVAGNFARSDDFVGLIAGDDFYMLDRRS